MRESFRDEMTSLAIAVAAVGLGFLVGLVVGWPIGLALKQLLGDTS